MALQNSKIGSKVFFSIGRRGEMPDKYAGRIVSPVTVSDGPKGPRQTATIITLQQNLQGDDYLNERVADLRFAWDRTETVEALDGTESEPKTVGQLIADRATGLDAFLASREQSLDVSAADAAPASDATEGAALA